ncbi:MAG TPA: hypothetical protein VJP85_08940 [Candidatus Baltobacteraceae bacterium]|nr:hypothetical protein [Candidatus Baltobacteraceae bacterium]
MRITAILAVSILLAACAGGGEHRGGTLSKDQYLSAIQVVPAPMRTGATGAPIVGMVISGTLTNGGAAPMRCLRSSFVLVRPAAGDVAPSGEFCTTPSIAPRQSTYFNVTFAAPPRDDWQLRFEHGDGSYEVHALAVPPG